MKLTSIKAGAAVALVLAILAGCGPTPPVRGQQERYGRSQVNLTSQELRRDTTVDYNNIRAVRDDSGLLHVTVPIRSTRGRQVFIDYRATFFDRNGQPLPQPTGWMSKVLEPRIFDQIQVNSTSPLAEDFQIDVRHSQ